MYCYIINIRPVTDEKLLRNIEKAPYSSLRSAFREELEGFIKQVLKNLRPKVINEQPINGASFCDLIINYGEMMNGQAIPNISSALVNNFISKSSLSVEKIKN